MKKFVLLVIVLLSVATSSCTNEKGLIHWDSVTIADLPFMLSYPDNYVDIMALKSTTDSISDNGIVSIFGGCGVVSDRYYTGAGIENTVKFYKRFPDINGYRVIIFTYFNQDDNDSYPAFELQTFDSMNHFIDRLIVGSATCGERTWTRSFECDKNYIFTIKDNVTIIDTEEGTNEDPPVSYSRVTDTFYILNENGYFVRYYDLEQVTINIYLADDWSDKTYPISKEQGEVRNHLRHGQWKLVEKCNTKDEISFIQGIGTYVSGVKNGSWDYYPINNDFSSLNNKAFSIIYENGTEKE